jgi:hypothetical protein
VLEQPEEKEMAELRAILARNAEAIQRLRAMLERLELVLATFSRRSDPPVQMPPFPHSAEADVDAEKN